MTLPDDTPPVPGGPRVLFSREEIAGRVHAIAHAIAAHPALQSNMDDLIVVCALRGAFVFTADLMRALSTLGIDPEMAFVQLASYGSGRVSTGSVTLISDLNADVTGRPVLFVDDILDSGLTLDYAHKHLQARGAFTVHTAVLLDKQATRAVDIKADFTGFTCPDVFVVGYGMDADGRYRGLPYVGILDEAEDE